MNEAFVEVNGVRTKIATWGRWIEESQGNIKDLIILIPGMIFVYLLTQT